MIKRKKNIFIRFFRNPKVQPFLSVILPVALGVLVFTLWQTQILHKILGTDTFTLPLPSQINRIIGDNLPKIMLNVKATVLVAVIGLAIGSFIGYLIAVLATVFPRWGTGGLSIVAAFNAIPIVALAPVMTNWTKDVSSDASVRSMVAKVLVVIIVSIATMSVNAYRGLNDLQEFSLDLMKSYAAKNRVVFFKLRLPNSVPYIFTALRVGVPSSVISAIVSEYFAEYITGVGRQIRENIVIAQYATAWTYIAVACLIGVSMYCLLMMFEGILLRNRK
ncbi:MAG: ABC transporter permease subunit [Clostridiales bacterium]|nr:ABC transporter permease subunit [Clostridiales bacterium]